MSVSGGLSCEAGSTYHTDPCMLTIHTQYSFIILSLKRKKEKEKLEAICPVLRCAALIVVL